MEIEVIRHTRTAKSTIGKLLINGSHAMNTLEDVERFGDGQDCSLKVPGETAIPKGRYELIINFSNRFQKYMPLLLNVPCFEGIRIHSGNISTHTEGCLLVGMYTGIDEVKDSRKAFTRLMTYLKVAEKKEKIFVTIT